MTVMMAMGDFDLSVGSTASLAGVVAATGFQHELGIPVALALALAVGLLCGLPALTLVAVAIAVLVWVSLEHLVIGRHLYVIGGNEQAARLAGIPVKRLRLMAFGVTGVGAAAAGLMLASRVASTNPIQGSGLMLDAIAAVFLGMTLVRSGEPHVLPTLAGVALLGVVDNGLTQLSVDSYVRGILVGTLVILVVAVSANHKRPLA